MKFLIAFLLILSSSLMWGQSACTSIVGIAVLDKIHIEPSYSRYEIASWGGSKADLDAEQHKINCKLAWAKTLRDPEQKASALCWLDYYQKDLNEAYSELRSHKEADQNKRIEGAEAEKQRQVNAYTKKHPVPSPPATCEVQR